MSFFSAWGVIVSLPIDSVHRALRYHRSNHTGCMPAKSFFLLPVVVLVQTCACMFSTPLSAQNHDQYYRGIVRGLELFGSVYREILERYADSLDPQLLAESGIAGMVTELDPYSAYTPATGSPKTRHVLRVGIGVEARSVDEMMTVVDVLDGSAAQNAGIRIGDRIVTVDGKEMLYESTDALYETLRGDIGTPVKVVLMRDGTDRETVLELKRERIQIPGLRFAGVLDDGIAVFQLERFSENAGNEFRTALLRLLRYDNDVDSVRGIILDLRGNSGGILEEAVSIAENFVPKGKVIVATDGRDTMEHEVWYSETDPIAAHLPLLVLVDRNSASASELLAAAIQDHDLGLVLGEPTIGKGVVQSVVTLPFGASFRVTTAWYITPSGRSIQRLDKLSGNGHQRIIPDSLTGEHYTDNGRPVESGAGVIPDSLVPGRSDESVVARLERAGAFFAFASEQTGRMDSLPGNFKVTDQMLTAFEEQALGRLLDVEQETGVLSSLDSLADWYVETRGGARIRQMFDELGTEIVRNDERQFAEDREEIRRVLEHTIRQRFLGREENIRATLKADGQVRAAISLLNDPGAYRRMLEGR